MLTGFCGRGDCSLDCNECLESEEEMGSEICNVGHEEIVYFSGRCPLCDMKQVVEAYEDSIESLLVQLHEEYMVVIP